jgi:hypothetical protein
MSCTTNEASAVRTHIDWLTFTVTMEYSTGTGVGFTDAIARALYTQFGERLADRAFGGEWRIRERSRAPYTDAWELEGAGVTIFASPSLTHACVEISGQGCERLIEREALNELLTKCHERITRIDIATDIETNQMPTEFITYVSHERMRASGYQKSESGETCYVGSQKSDRYARVYRYNKPHPRHNLLRIEHVFRRKYAKNVARNCIEHGTDVVARAAGEAFGWNSPIWKPHAAVSCDISITAPERKMGKTVFWLIKACAPAFRRLCADGTIRDPQQFINDYFFPYNGEE